jgi:large subunit ribosomal protein L21
MFAIIRTGSKQYRVATGDRISVEMLEGEAGTTVTLDDVLLVSNGEKLTVGNPRVSGAKVEARIVEQTRDDKKIVFKYHSKVRRRKKKGHRQHKTELEITNIASEK